MITEDQTEVVAFLGSPSTYAGAAVVRIETHASIVFLAGTRALKLKRAVRYDYLDFSTAERRRAMCHAEVRINRRAAPAIYRGVLAITREQDGSLALAGPGAPVEWVVEMARFAQDGLFDRLAARGALDVDLMGALADAIARCHRTADRRSDRGGRSGMAWVIDGNATGFAEECAGVFDPAGCASVTSDARSALDRHGALLDARRDAGFVRQCHGDLHLRNIVLLEGNPTLFDAVEFNEDISCIDTAYDLAFLLMDLWRRRLPSHANRVWNGYLAETTDFESLPAVPLFLSCRAAVRAKTTAAAANLHGDPRRRIELQEMAREYLAMAQRLLRPASPCLVAVGGYSGSGKSTLALALGPLAGPVPGAVVIRSDDIRKRLCGVDPLVPLGPEGYTPAVSRRVYATVVNRAKTVACGGHAAIVDAVFVHHADREAIQQAAVAAGVGFVGLWLDAPESVLVARAAGRHLDPSDADATVIRGQLAEDMGSVPWCRIDATSSAEIVLAQAIAVLHDRLGGGIRDDFFLPGPAAGT